MLQRKSPNFNMSIIMENKNPAIYIMTNKMNGTLYIGVTSNLLKRVFEHKSDIGSEFCSKYNCKILVWYLFFDVMTDAIHVEKLLKRGSRARKLRLIEEINPSWNDLYAEICDQF